MSDEAARLQAFDIAGKLVLPVRTRTWTARELRRNELRLFWIAIGATVLVCGWLLTGIALDGGRQSRMLLPWVAPALLLLMAVAGWSAWRRLRKYADYRDTQVSVEVERSGVAIVWEAQGQRIDLDWAEVDYLFYWQRIRHGTTFLGIQLNTEAGPFNINDQWFSGGRKAAAVIVAEHDKWRVLRRTG